MLFLADLGKHFLEPWFTATNLRRYSQGWTVQILGAGGAKMAQRSGGESMNELNHHQTFERLVLRCIDADFCVEHVNTKYPLETSSRDLQDLRTSAPLRPHV